MSSNKSISKTARYILDAFDNYLARFFKITRRARRRFERRDWRGRYGDAIQRLDLYEKSLVEVAKGLKYCLGDKIRSRKTWVEIKDTYIGEIKDRHDMEIARTFFNSITRKIFNTVGLDREIEYFSLAQEQTSANSDHNIYKSYPESLPTRDVIKQIMLDRDFKSEFEDIERDAELVSQEIDLYLWPILGFDKSRVIETINSIFFRNRAAYIVGRIRADNCILPMVMPVHNGEDGIYIDAVLLSEAEVSTVFSFAYSYFHIDCRRQDALIDFLKSILPEKLAAELYTSIGFNRHGKTEFYKTLHKFIHESHELFIIAPGKEGAVMSVFTLPDFNFVFKVIKDRPCFLRSRELTPKTISASEVKAKYDFVRQRDRAGRMVDTQEFENLRFRRSRFSSKLLREFMTASKDNVMEDDDHIVFRHLYVQRKVTPLPIYLLEEKDPEAIRSIVIDFGYFLKDLAVTGIFPGDLFNTWNYGVTNRGRVVLFDYDDVMPLEDVNFREKPQPIDEKQEMEPEENWIMAASNDYFLDEIYRFSGIPNPLKGIFQEIHSDLLTFQYWNNAKHRISKNESIDITPYDRSKRFKNSSWRRAARAPHISS